MQKPYNNANPRINSERPATGICSDCSRRTEGRVVSPRKDLIEGLQPACDLRRTATDQETDAP